MSAISPLHFAPVRYSEYLVLSEVHVGHAACIVAPHNVPQVMRLLERLYDKFDLAAEMCGMFKVETIGDAYVGATNLVHPQPDHTKRVAQFAIAVRASPSIRRIYHLARV